MLLGSIRSLPNPTRLRITSAIASAENPELMCTTVPPAKSMAPSVCSQPPPHTQWAKGSYTSVVQSRPKMMNEEILTLSANTDVTIARVTVANTSWNIMYASAGTVSVTPAMTAAFCPTLLSPRKSQVTD